MERYPQLGNRQQVSTDGGNWPIWSRDGRMLFFRSLDLRQVLSVAVQSGTTLTAGRPRALFDMPMPAPVGGSRSWDAAPDGRLFLVRNAQADGGAPAPSLVLVQNWTDELKRLVPAR